MIIEVVIDMRFFLCLLMFTMFAFSGSFLLLSLNNENKDDQFLGGLLEATAMVYELVLGNFDTENFGETNYLLMWIFFMGASIFLIIVMLNLLIAIISDTFERVQGSQKQRMY